MGGDSEKGSPQMTAASSPATDGRPSVAAEVCLLAAFLLLLTACSDRPACLADEKETGVVDEIVNIGPPDYSRTWQRLRIVRDSDKTVCSSAPRGWLYRPGDKVRGPL